MAAIVDVTVIERAVIAHLTERITAIRKSRVQKTDRFLFTNPALAVSIFESGPFVPQGQKSYIVPCTVNILLTFQNAASEEARREGVNPLVMGIIQTLMQQTLGLPLKEPGLVPKRFRDVTDDEEWKQNKIVYLIEFSCAFYMARLEDAAADDLITIGLSYLLKPGDDIADAADTITTIP